MKIKVLSILFVFLSIFSLILLPLKVSSENVETEDIINGIIEYNVEKGNFQSCEEWVEKSFPENVGISTEWYVLALSQWGKYNFSPYEKALNEYLETKKVSSASTRLKFAFVLASMGSESEYIEETLENSMGKQGIMSIVYGLHLLNNGYTHSSYTVESAVDELLNMQLSEGGWDLRKQSIDVDVTAMVIQALAPYYSLEKVKIAVDKAILCVSKKMLDDCDFSSYGVPNPESGCQVIVALSSLGIDFISDQRFLKNGKNLLDGIIKYKMPNGSFSHSSDMKTNENATVQVFYSLVAYEKMKNGKGSIYILNKKENDNDLSNSDNSSQSSELINSSESSESSELINSSESSESSELINSSESSEFINSENFSELFENSDVSLPDELASKDNFEEVSENSNEKTDKSNKKSFKIKTIIIVSISILYIVIILVFVLRKKLNFKNFIFISICFLVVLCIFIFSDIQTKDSYYNSNGISKENAVGKVSISIDCKVLKNFSDNSYIPKDGIILNETEFAICQGETVYDILVEATKKYSIHMENNGTSELAYISGINYLYEFDYGDLSGWIFKVNGVESSVGCSSFVLSDGDVIEWCYTLNYGKDIE